MAPEKELGRKYRIPREEAIREVISEILKDAMTIRSQVKFHGLVLYKLQERLGADVRLSEQRLRRISAQTKGVDLIIHCREGERRTQGATCPVCGSRMDDIKNSTLYGWTVSTGKFCPICHYWTGPRARIPTRYVFTVEKGRHLGERMEK